MKKKKNISVIVILVICILGLSSFIIYDKVLNEDKNKVVNKDNNEVIDTPQKFINKIATTEEALKNKEEYTVNYKDFSFTAYRNEYNQIRNIIIKKNDKQINKDLSKITDTGFHTLNSYYFDEETGLFILTLTITPVASSPSTYIIAFDTNGNIKLDEAVGYQIYVDENKSTLFYTYILSGIGGCKSDSVDQEMIYSEIKEYQYFDNIDNTNKIEEGTILNQKVKELPECGSFEN